MKFNDILLLKDCFFNLKIIKKNTNQCLNDWAIILSLLCVLMQKKAQIKLIKNIASLSRGAICFIG